MLWKANKAQDKKYHWCVEHQQWEEEPHEESLEKVAPIVATAVRGLAGGFAPKVGENIANKLVPNEEKNIEKILPALVGLLMSDKNVKKEHDPYKVREGSSFTQEDLAELERDDTGMTGKNKAKYPQHPDAGTNTVTDILGHQQEPGARQQKNPTPSVKVENALLKLMKQGTINPVTGEPEDKPKPTIPAGERANTIRGGPSSTRFPTAMTQTASKEELQALYAQEGATPDQADQVDRRKEMLDRTSQIQNALLKLMKDTSPIPPSKRLPKPTPQKEQPLDMRNPANVIRANPNMLGHIPPEAVNDADFNYQFNRHESGDMVGPGEAESVSDSYPTADTVQHLESKYAHLHPNPTPKYLDAVRAGDVKKALLKLMKEEKPSRLDKPSRFADKYPKNQEPFTPDQMDAYVQNLHAGNADIPINHYKALNYMANGKYSLAPSMMVGGINARRERPKNKNTGKAVSFGTDPRETSLPFDEHPPMTIHEFHEHFLKATPNTGTYGHLRDSGSTTPENAYYRATHGPTGWHTSVSSNAEAKPTEGISSMREDARISAGNQENLPNAKAYATHWDAINNDIAALSAEHNLANATRGGDDTWQIPKGIENALLKLMKAPPYRYPGTDMDSSKRNLDIPLGQGKAPFAGISPGDAMAQKLAEAKRAKAQERKDAQGPVTRAIESIPGKLKQAPGQIKRVAEATGRGAKDVVSPENLSRWAGVEQSLLKLMKEGTVNMHNTAMPRKRAMENAVGQSTAKAEQTTSEQLETERGRGDDNGTANALGQSVIQGVEGLIMNRGRWAGSGMGGNGTNGTNTTPASIVEPSEAAEANQNGSGKHWGNTFGSPGGIGGGSSKPVTPKTVPEVYEPEPVGKDMYQPDPENDPELKKPVPELF